MSNFEYALCGVIAVNVLVTLILIATKADKASLPRGRWDGNYRVAYFPHDNSYRAQRAAPSSIDDIVFWSCMGKPPISHMTYDEAAKECDDHHKADLNSTAAEKVVGLA